MAESEWISHEASGTEPRDIPWRPVFRHTNGRGYSPYRVLPCTLSPPSGVGMPLWLGPRNHSVSHTPTLVPSCWQS